MRIHYLICTLAIWVTACGGTGSGSQSGSAATPSPGAKLISTERCFYTQPESAPTGQACASELSLQMNLSTYSDGTVTASCINRNGAVQSCNAGTISMAYTFLCVFNGTQTIFLSSSYGFIASECH